MEKEKKEKLNKALFFLCILVCIIGSIWFAITSINKSGIDTENILVVSILTGIPIISIVIYFLIHKKRKAILLKVIIVLFAIIFSGVFAAIQLEPLLKGADTLGFFAFLGGLLGIIAVFVGIISGKKKK